MVIAMNIVSDLGAIRKTEWLPVLLADGDTACGVGNPVVLGELIRVGERLDARPELFS